MTSLCPVVLQIALLLCTGAQAATDSARYNFEAGTQGWAVGSASISGISSSSARASAGGRSLAIQFAATKAVTQQTVVVRNPGIPKGAVVTLQVYLPAGIPLESMKLFVQESAATQQ